LHLGLVKHILSVMKGQLRDSILEHLKIKCDILNPDAGIWHNCYIYVSGPMTGYPELNTPAFDCVSKGLRRLPLNRVFNPAENDGGSKDKGWAFYMRLDLISVALADRLVLLPGWEKSRGAQVEIANAISLKIPLYEVVNKNFKEDGHLLLEPVEPVLYLSVRRSLPKEIKRWLTKVRRAILG
jgi:Domain of unknown function (DUF4406)